LSQITNEKSVHFVGSYYIKYITMHTN